MHIFIEFISTTNSPPNPKIYLHYHVGECVLIGAQISAPLLLATPIVYEVGTRHKPLLLKLYESKSYKMITNKSMVLASTVNLIHNNNMQVEKLV